MIRKNIFIIVLFGIILISGFSQYVLATPIYGSIAVSVVLIDSERNIIDGYNEEGAFLIELRSPSGFSSVLEFQTPFSLNHSVFGGVYDSYSIVLNNLRIYDIYYYSEMEVKSGDWKVLGYNDQLVSKVSSLDDFYPIDYNNVDSNRIINLALSKGRDRELVILLGSTNTNNESSSPVPEPSTLLMIGAGASSTIIGSHIKRKLKSRIKK